MAFKNRDAENIDPDRVAIKLSDTGLTAEYKCYSIFPEKISQRLRMKHLYSWSSPSAYFPYISYLRNKNRFPRRIRIVPMKLKRMGIQGHKIEPLIMKQLLKDRVFLNDR